MSAATREAIRTRHGWVVSLWLSAPRYSGSSGRHHHELDDVGPMRGTIYLEDDPDSQHFVFARLGGGVVRVAYDQVSMWLELTPPPRPPLSVEDTPR